MLVLREWRQKIEKHWPRGLICPPLQIHLISRSFCGFSTCGGSTHLQFLFVKLCRFHYWAQLASFKISLKSVNLIYDNPFPFICKSISQTEVLRHILLNCKIGKGKAVPLQAWSGPEGSRNLKIPDFMTTAQDGGKVVSLTHRPPLPPGNTPGTHFC